MMTLSTDLAPAPDHRIGPRPGLTLADVAIVIVTCNAQQTIASVLDRIPRTVAASVGAILVSDDASKDATVEVARRWAATHHDVNVTVIGQPAHLGYGGNRKFCFRWAVEHRYAVAVMVHGNGRYAPELVGSIVEPLLRGRCDAVFGARPMSWSVARRGGMAATAWVAKRALTTVQNTLTGLHLSEWHSGYRAYNLTQMNMAALAGMSDGYEFDTEIVLDLARRRRTIAEIGIPPFYDDEQCNLNSVGDVWRVMAGTARAATRWTRATATLSVRHETATFGALPSLAGGRPSGYRRRADGLGIADARRARG